VSGSDLQLLRAVAAGQVHLTAAERPISMPRGRQLLGKAVPFRCRRRRVCGRVDPPREPDRHLQQGLRMVGRGAATTAEQDGTLPWEATNPSGRAELLPHARGNRVGQMPARKTALSQAA